MYICIAHSGREVGGSEARMIIPADQTESREERSKVEEFYVTRGTESAAKLNVVRRAAYQSAGDSRLSAHKHRIVIYAENNFLRRIRSKFMHICICVSECGSILCDQLCRLLMGLMSDRHSRVWIRISLCTRDKVSRFDKNEI